MTTNFKVSFSNENCKHNEYCGCKVSITGISDKTLGFTYTSTMNTISDQYHDIVSRMAPWSPSEDLRSQAQKEISFIKTSMPKDSVMTLIKPPVKSMALWPDPVLPIKPDRAVDAVLKQADYLYFQYKFPGIFTSLSEMEAYIWSEVLPTSSPNMLMHLAMREMSSYQWVFGKYKKRPMWLPAMQDLYPFKIGKAVLHMARPDLGQVPQTITRFMNNAIRHLYRLMGVDLFKKFTEPLTFKHLVGSYMGSSNGFQEGERKEIKQKGINVKVSPCGKKIDTLEQDIDAFLEFMRTGKEPPIYWVISAKSENFFEDVRKMSDEEWEKFKTKLRLFIIPSGLFVMMEKMVSTMRHLKERGKVIRIGHRWPKGGADTIAKLLGINLLNEFMKVLVEGDVSKFDQSVQEMFVDAYFNTLLIHHDRDSKDFPLFERIVKFLLKNIIIRITRLYGELWAIIRGQVPSGCFNTSHMDSWIMGLYMCLFCLYQIHNAPEIDQEDLEMFFLDLFKCIVYGDDFLYYKGTGKVSVYFGGQAFKDFMLRHLNIDVRDLKDGISFLSRVKDGIIIIRGATFLRHQFVLNPYYDDPLYPGQPRYLPFRESKEYMLRAVYSRESRSRDIIDILLSTKGLAYATYASNWDAYYRLGTLYSKLAAQVGGTEEELYAQFESRVTEQTIKSLRIMGISREELLGGFPSWDTLIRKNRYDPEYQDISLPGENYDPESLVEAEPDAGFDWAY